MIATILAAVATIGSAPDSSPSPTLEPIATPDQYGTVRRDRGGRGSWRTVMDVVPDGGESVHGVRWPK